MSRMGAKRDLSEVSGSGLNRTDYCMHARNLKPDYSIYGGFKICFYRYDEQGLPGETGNAHGGARVVGTMHHLAARFGLHVFHVHFLTLPTPVAAGSPT